MALLLLLQPQGGLQLALARVGVGGGLGRMVVRVARLTAIGGEIACLGTLMCLACEALETRCLILLRHALILAPPVGAPSPAPRR